ncbi:MAG: hypothetical protein WC107_07240 [Patescibacteria group bacterium]
MPQKVREVGMDIFGDTTRGGVVILRNAVFSFTPQCFGHLRNSIGAETIVSADQILGHIKTSIPYALPVELGSKPHWPPLAPLILWVKRKLGGAGSSMRTEAKISAASLRSGGFKGVRAKDMMEGMIEGTARRIQFAIARRGTRAHLMFQKGFDERGPTVVAMFERAIEKFVEQVSKL